MLLLILTPLKTLTILSRALLSTTEASKWNSSWFIRENFQAIIWINFPLISYIVYVKYEISSGEIDMKIDDEKSKQKHFSSFVFFDCWQVFISYSFPFLMIPYGLWKKLDDIDIECVCFWTHEWDKSAIKNFFFLFH